MSDPAAITPFRGLSNSDIEFGVESARLDLALDRCCAIGGFPRTVAAIHQALRSLAARERACGRDTGEFIG